MEDSGGCEASVLYEDAFIRLGADKFSKSPSHGEQQVVVFQTDELVWVGLDAVR